MNLQDTSNFLHDQAEGLRRISAVHEGAEADVCLWFHSSTNENGVHGAPEICLKRGCTGKMKDCEEYEPVGIVEQQDAMNEKLLDGIFEEKP